MKKFLQLSLFTGILCLFFSTDLFSQSDRFKYLCYVFPSDSLSGFDEISTKQNALDRGFFGSEYKVFMYRAKRNFINEKYGYNQNTFLNNAKGSTPIINTAPCVNEDFEASPVGLVGATLAGWTISEGSNSGSCTMAGCCPTAGGLDAWIRTTPYVSGTTIGTIPNSPFGGTKILQMNDAVTNMGEVVRIQQTFPVTATSALFKLAYMAQMDGTGHVCCDQPYLKITMLNCANVPLACPSLSLNAPGASCASTMPSGWSTNTSGYSFTTAWQIYSLDLTPYLGSCVTIQVTVGDCDGWAHHGMAFIDCDCDPMNVTVNNLQFPIGTTAANTSACGVTSATVTAPPGLGPYSWTGPGGSGVTNNPNQTFTTSVAGNYTLTMTPPGSCAPVTRTVTLAFVPNPIATFSQANSCTTYTFTNTGTAAPAVQTFSFVGPSAPASFTTTSATSVVNFAPSTTYTVYHTVTNTSSCTATNSMVINVGVGSSPAFTTPTYTQCLNGNSFTFNAAIAAGTHTYAFNPTVGAPATGLTNPYGPVSFTAPGTYTVTHTITNAGCTASTSSVVLINPQPTVTANNNGPICLGGNVAFTGTGGGTYAWTGPNAFASAVQNPTIVGVSAAASGTYILTVTLAGCTNTASTILSISTPTASAANTGPYCAGSTIQLNGSAGTSYTWTGPGAYNSNLQNPTITASTPAMSGTYSFVVNLGGCFSSGTTAVTVNALPTPTAGSNSPICEGVTLNLTGSAASTYTWTGPNSFNNNSQNPSIPSASTAASGTYTLQVIDGNNCTNSVTTVVVVNANPIIVVTNPTVCLNQTINLTATGGTGYAWSGPLGFTSAAQNPNIASATLGMSGAYTVTVTTAQGCTNTAVANANVFPVPSPTIVTNSPVCDGGVLTLNGSGGANYAWSGPNGFMNLNQNTSISPVTMLANGTYTLLASAGTCTALTTLAVTINPLPTPNIVSNSPVCIGTDINLTGSGGTSYAWAGPNGFTSATQNPTVSPSTMQSSGTYTLVVTDANNCVNFTNANVVVNPQPIVSASGSTVCENANANLNANGGVSYSWSGPGGFVSASQNPQLNSITFSSAGQYTVLVTDINTCTNTAVTSIIVNPAPIANASGNNPCLNDNINLSATGGANYSWNGPSGYSSNLQNPVISASTLNNSGNYVVTVTDINGCIAIANINVTVNPLPVPNITSGPNKGCAPLCVQYTVNSTPSPSTAVWTLGNGVGASGLNAETCYNTPGVYTITAGISDQNGCSGVATYTAEVYPKPIADFNHAPIKPILNIDPDVTFTDASHGANIVSWNWYFMDNAQYTSNLQNPIFVYTEPGTYVVALVVKSDKGCYDTILRPLVVGEDFGIYVPNSFTPNNDGLNEIFQPKGFGVVKYNLKIFDRWGEMIFETSTFEEGWDGKYHGRGEKIIQNGVYTWLIECTSVFGKAHELKGHVTLIK